MNFYFSYREILLKRRTFIWGVILILFFQSILPIISSNEGFSKNIIYVDDSNKYGPWDGTQVHPYKNINDGVNVASDGDTVFVYNGTYQDYEMHIKKSINLKGENKTNTIIEEGQIIFMTSASSSLSGFNIRYCTIVSENQDYVEIYNNNITGGIAVFNTIESYIHHNIINGVEGTEPAIKLSDGCCNIVEYNVINTNYEGGIAVFGNSNIISNNTITNNIGESGYGIRLDGNNNKIKDNHIANNVFGIKLDYAFGNIIERNNFIDNVVQVYLFGTFDTIGKTKNLWDYNFWDRPKIYPKFLLGLDIIPMPGAGDLLFWIPILIIQVDWHPRLIPYDIPNSEL